MTLAPAAPTGDASTTGSAVRLAAARVVAQVAARGRSLTTALPAQSKKIAAADQALLAELCYGTLRWYHRLRLIRDALLSRPLKPREHEVGALLLVGLYQREYLDIPAYAAVAATVAAAHDLNKPWAPGLVNAVLRGAERKPDQIARALTTDAAAASAHPDWLYRHLGRAWPEQRDTIVAANNERPPSHLRVNLSRASRDAYRQQLSEAGRDAAAGEHGPATLCPTQPIATSDLPGFETGLVSVQDAAAQLAAPLLDPQPGDRVLDACAAPGGKTGHLLELAPAAGVLALDIDRRRLATVADTLRRLRLRAELKHGDAANPADWWDGQPFDRILLDAPCTATGAIRRHPDIKLLRRSADVASAAEGQQRLLDALWPVLRPGGHLLYATCSILPAENHERIAEFVERHPDAAAAPIAASWGAAQRYGRQILPGQHGMDGFYYALLRKQS